jgi:hypothetical protein
VGFASITTIGIMFGQNLHPDQDLVFSDLYRITSVTVSLIVTLTLVFLMHRILNCFAPTRSVMTDYPSAGSWRCTATLPPPADTAPPYSGDYPASRRVFRSLNQMHSPQPLRSWRGISFTRKQRPPPAGLCASAPPPPLNEIKTELLTAPPLTLADQRRADRPGELGVGMGVTAIPTCFPACGRRRRSG